jgi:gliding motility-associated lipoprotein GldH
MRNAIIGKKVTFYFKLFSLFGLIVLLSSCGRNIVYSKYQTFENKEWQAKDKVTFDLEMQDIQSLHDISVMVRHADSYPYSNLYLFLSTKYPDGKVTLDTLECILANEKGEWMGDGAGDIFDITIPLKRSTRFPLAGKYSFTFEQAMRTDPLPMIMDFGFEVKKSKAVN